MALYLALVNEDDDGGGAYVLSKVSIPALRDEARKRVVTATTAAMHEAIQEEAAREVLAPPLSPQRSPL